jgi:heme A synthase
LERTRVVHPVLAILLASFVGWAVSWAGKRSSAGPLANAVKLSLVGQLVLGGLNVLLSAPAWLQLVHLGAAKGMWILLVFFALSALASPRKAGVSL